MGFCYKILFFLFCFKPGSRYLSNGMELKTSHQSCLSGDIITWRHEWRRIFHHLRGIQYLRLIVGPFSWWVSPLIRMIKLQDDCRERDLSFEWVSIYLSIYLYNSNDKTMFDKQQSWNDFIFWHVSFIFPFMDISIHQSEIKYFTPTSWATVY